MLDLSSEALDSTLRSLLAVQSQASHLTSLSIMLLYYGDENSNLTGLYWEIHKRDDCKIQPHISCVDIDKNLNIWLY